MIRADEAFARLKRIPAYARVLPEHYRSMVHTQKFTSVASLGTQQAAQSFQGGAVVLGITAAVIIPGVAAATGQSARNRQLVGASFQFTNGDLITPGGPVQLDSLMGSDGTHFPLREIVLAPNQSILATVENYSTTVLNVEISYHVMSFRFAS